MGSISISSAPDDGFPTGDSAANPASACVAVVGVVWLLKQAATVTVGATLLETASVRYAERRGDDANGEDEDADDDEWAREGSWEEAVLVGEEKE